MVFESVVQSEHSSGERWVKGVVWLRGRPWVKREREREREREGVNIIQKHTKREEAMSANFASVQACEHLFFRVWVWVRISILLFTVWGV